MNNAAFPIPHYLSPNGETQWGNEGMTLRDYYFGKVLQGFCANPAIFAQNGMSGFALVNCSEGVLVQYALSIANTAIAELEKQIPQQ